MRSNRFIKWENGIPKPADFDIMTKSQFESLPMVFQSTPYQPETDPDTGQILAAEYVYRNADGTWMTNAEVAQARRSLRAARGDLEALRNIEDRVLGKPKQSAEIVSVHGTLSEWIEASMKNEAQWRDEGTITDVTVLGPVTLLESDEENVEHGETLNLIAKQTAATVEPDMGWL